MKKDKLATCLALLDLMKAIEIITKMQAAILKNPHKNVGAMVRMRGVKKEGISMIEISLDEEGNIHQLLKMYLIHLFENLL